ncbi:hypothetical protein ACRE1S_00205 [Helicobacter himalayensis]|uniref:hypothetical protein n=1 Tax=Helicobacter himalayensis TaxID=1591088 RepID=UPI003D6E323D
MSAQMGIHTILGNSRFSFFFEIRQPILDSIKARESISLIKIKMLKCRADFLRR